VLELT